MHLLACNFAVSADELLATLPPCSTRLVSFQASRRAALTVIIPQAICVSYSQNFISPAKLNKILTLWTHTGRAIATIQFPDPWRRLKHRKRLIVQPALVRCLASHMSEGALVYLSSDNEMVGGNRFIHLNFFVDLI